MAPLTELDEIGEQNGQLILILSQDKGSLLDDNFSLNETNPIQMKNEMMAIDLDDNTAP